MSLGVIGKKIGMSRLFDDEGRSIPVTVVEVGEQRIAQIKSLKKDGYSAVQIAAGAAKEKHLSRAIVGHMQRHAVSGARRLVEFRLNESTEKVEEKLAAIKPGTSFNATIFAVGQKVDVTGNSKGKGFQGGVKRWNFSMQDATHGNSLSHRANGSIGQCQTPGKVWKGKKMSGQMGNCRVTVQGLEVVRIDVEHNLLLIKGAVPGAVNGDVVVRSSAKAQSVPWPQQLESSSNDAGGDDSEPQGAEVEDK